MNPQAGDSSAKQCSLKKIVASFPSLRLIELSAMIELYMSQQHIKLSFYLSLFILFSFTLIAIWLERMSFFSPGPEVIELRKRHFYALQLIARIDLVHWKVWLFCRCTRFAFIFFSIFNDFSLYFQFESCGRSNSSRSISFTHSLVPLLQLSFLSIFGRCMKWNFQFITAAICNC